jgi:hypothetical protein
MSNTTENLLIEMALAEHFMFFQMFRKRIDVHDPYKQGLPNEMYHKLKTAILQAQVEQAEKKQSQK